MSRQTIPAQVREWADEIIQRFNTNVIKNPKRAYIARYRGSYLYLDRLEYEKQRPIARLTYAGSPEDWAFAIYKYSDERYDAEEWLFPGSEHVDGTIEGAMKAGLEAYP